ncbi:hypothetical protein MBLNU230_g5219t1 [Neophaeotheca triangularis]
MAPQGSSATDLSMSTSPGLTVKAMSSPPPIQRILDVYELSEAVLLHLGIHDLVQARNTCSKMRNVVDTSLPIKKAMFMVPGDDREVWLVMNEKHEKKVYTGAAALNIRQTLDDPKHPKADKRVLLAVRPVLLNPVLLRVASTSLIYHTMSNSDTAEITRDMVDLRSRIDDLVHYRVFPDIRMGELEVVLGGTGLRYCPKDSVYMSMFLTSPPIKSVAWNVHGKRPLVNKDGLQWRNIVESLKRWEDAPKLFPGKKDVMGINEDHLAAIEEEVFAIPKW